MNLFSISQLQQFSGIKAHTIRMWEQRYNALKPNRSEGNTRYYDNIQLKRLLNIVSLMSAGFKVSDLCVMPDEKLFTLLDDHLKDPLPQDDTAEYFISQLLSAGMTLDETYFEKIFSSCVLRLGIRNTYVRVIYPMLTRIGMMWVTDKISPAYEHFISNFIRQKIFVAIDSLPPPKSSGKTWLLLLPENEFHEMGLLFSHYLIRQSGDKVIYLGSNVPLDTLSGIKNQVNPSQLLLFVVHQSEHDKLQEYLAGLKKIFSHSKIHISGSEKVTGRINRGNHYNLIHSVEDLEKELSRGK